ncbi:GGDEF domain-containing protein [Marinobacter sp.]|uniref:GGDEF domain-containing protein n=1 Tax=Marinobacter sp. TaxID=50741 RepID=UPI0035639FAA
MKQTAAKTPDTELSQFRVKGEIPVPVLINWLTSAAVPILLFFAGRAASTADSPFTAPLLVTFAGLLALNSLAYLGIRHQTLHRRAFIGLITALFTFLVVQAVEDGSAIIWLFAYPPVIFYISQARVGIIACAGGLAALVFLFSPVGDLVFEPPYSTSFRISMVIVLCFEMVTCYILDQSRRRSKLRLLRLASEFEFAAKHDALTGLANRREGLEQLETEYQRYLRTQRPFSVMLMDIDLFKGINDHYGHHAGDELIRMVARTLREQCRKVDTVARWGGEEYLVLLPETGADEALQTAQRIRAGVEAGSVEVDGHRLGATISIGTATIAGSESIDRLLQRADEALYGAKSAGRNQACAATI